MNEKNRKFMESIPTAGSYSDGLLGRRFDSGAGRPQFAESASRRSSFLESIQSLSDGLFDFILGANRGRPSAGQWCRELSRSGSLMGVSYLCSCGFQSTICLRTWTASVGSMSDAHNAVRSRSSLSGCGPTRSSSRISRPDAVAPRHGISGHDL